MLVLSSSSLLYWGVSEWWHKSVPAELVMPELQPELQHLLVPKLHLWDLVSRAESLIFKGVTSSFAPSVMLKAKRTHLALYTCLAPSEKWHPQNLPFASCWASLSAQDSQVVLGNRKNLSTAERICMQSSCFCEQDKLMQNSVLWVCNLTINI